MECITKIFFIICHHGHHSIHHEYQVSVNSLNCTLFLLPTYCFLLHKFYAIYFCNIFFTPLENKTIPIPSNRCWLHYYYCSLRFIIKHPKRDMIYLDVSFVTFPKLNVNTTLCTDIIYYWRFLYFRFIILSNLTVICQKIKISILDSYTIYMNFVVTISMKSNNVLFDNELFDHYLNWKIICA